MINEKMSDSNQKFNIKDASEKEFHEEQIQAIKTSEFMKETIKQRPINRKKLIRRILVTVAMAVVFGLVACFTFLILEPIINKKLNPTKDEVIETVSFIEETVEEETNPEDMIVDEYELQPIVVEQGPLTDEQINQVLGSFNLDISNYTQMNNAINALVRDLQNSVVNVIGITQDEDWFDNRVSNEDIVTGAIVADNNRDLLVLANVKQLSSIDELEVDFGDGSSYEASVLARDYITGMAIIAVRKTYIKAATLEKVKIFELGSSASLSLTGTPIVAIGRPMGIDSSMGIGYVTSNSMPISLPDSNYKYVTTDIVGSKSGSGVLVNLRGQLIGIIDMHFNKEDMSNMVSAIGITELKKVVERLSNGKEIPYLGIYGMDISDEIREEMSLPIGVYIKAIEMDSPLLEAGIQSGDVLTKISGNEVHTYGVLLDNLMNMSPEDTVIVEVMREGPDGYTRLNMTVVLRKGEEHQ